MEERKAISEYPVGTIYGEEEIDAIKNVYNQEKLLQEVQRLKPLKRNLQLIAVQNMQYQQVHAEQH